MIILVSSTPADQFYTDPLGVPVFEDLRPPHREAGRVDFRLSGVFSTWIEDGAVDTMAIAGMALLVDPEHGTEKWEKERSKS